MDEIILGTTQLSLKQGDITKQSTDAIVNAANSWLMGGGGVDGAIHRAAGPVIMDECKIIIDRIGRLPPGQAVITSGGNLPAKYVIHTVGPVWRGGHSHESEILASCYTESLKIATDKKLRSISFPAISTGAYGYPLEESAEVAINATVGYLTNNITTLEIIYFVLYDNYSLEVYKEALSRIIGK